MGVNPSKNTGGCMKRVLMILVNLLWFAGTIGMAAADPITGELFYTRFSGAPNVKRVTVSYDGATSFSLGTPVVVGTTPGADGLVGNPQNPDLLIVAGQGSDISTISKTTG